VNSDPDERTALETLAREGEALRAAVLAEQRAAERASAVRERRELRRLGVTHLLGALAERPRPPAPPLLVLTLGVVLVSAILWLGAEWVGAPPVVSSVGLAGVIVFPLLYFVAQRWQGVRALHRERRWLRGLPFPVRGYFTALTEAPSEESTLTVRFRLVDDGPGEAVLLGLAGRSGTVVTVRRARDGWEVSSGAILSPASEDIGPSNGPRLSWMRGIITEMLLPLHAEHRVVAVRFVP
jgi:hypothetical protein